MSGRIAGQGSNWIKRDKRLAIYLRDGNGCVYCSRGIESGVLLTLDHVVPCELGGTNEASNLVTACGRCNSSKQALPLGDFLLVLADRGIDTAEIPARIRALTGTDLAPYRTQAKEMLAARNQGDGE